MADRRLHTLSTPQAGFYPSHLSPHGIAPYAGSHEGLHAHNLLGVISLGSFHPSGLVIAVIKPTAKSRGIQSVMVRNGDTGLTNQFSRTPW